MYQRMLFPAPATNAKSRLNKNGKVKHSDTHVFRESINENLS